MFKKTVISALLLVAFVLAACSTPGGADEPAFPQVTTTPTMMDNGALGDALSTIAAYEAASAQPDDAMPVPSTATPVPPAAANPAFCDPDATEVLSGMKFHVPAGDKVVVWDKWDNGYLVSCSANGVKSVTQVSAGPAATNTPVVSKNAVSVGNPPFAVKQVQEDHGRTVTILSGFDMNEFGGDDNDCGRGELDFDALREEVGSPDEDCKIVLEWSLKTGDTTLVSGVFAMEPEEEAISQFADWIRLTHAQASGETRFVGTIHYLPKGWNAHMYAANVAADWQPKNPDLVSYVGLSPTDPWVMSIWEAAEGAKP